MKAWIAGKERWISGFTLGKPEQVIFFLLLIIQLLPVLMNQHFLTQDGPSHLYNAKILLDWWSGDHRFYDQVYYLNPDWQPNWFSHLFLAAALSVLPAWLADKLLQILCLLVFSFGFRFLVSKINPKEKWISWLGLLILYQHPMIMGFYNYILGMGIMMFLAGMWYVKGAGVTWNDSRKIFFFAAAALLLWFMHPITFGYYLFTAGLMTVFRPGDRPASFSFRKLVHEILMLLLVSLPALFMHLWIMTRNSEKPVVFQEKGALLDWLLEMRYLLIFQQNELWLYRIWYILALAAAAAGLIRFFRKKDAAAALAAAAFLTLALYFFFPDHLPAGGVFSLRLFILPILFGLLSFTLIPWKSVSRLTVAVFCILSLLYLQHIRIPRFKKISETVNIYQKAYDCVDNQSVVLPLSFSHTGVLPDNYVTSPNIWLYMHAADYMGAEDKQLILLDNYEGNTGHFPVVWKEDVDPFYHLSRGFGIEGQPPEADVLHYEKHTGLKVDFITTWGDPAFYPEEAYPSPAEWMRFLESRYDLVCSEDGMLQVWKRKDGE